METYKEREGFIIFEEYVARSSIEPKTHILKNKNAQIPHEPQNPPPNPALRLPHARGWGKAAWLFCHQLQ